ncbi:hypothetical protein LguiB_027789 [Lonicera macranthoides]
MTRVLGSCMTFKSLYRNKAPLHLFTVHTLTTGLECTLTTGLVVKTECAIIERSVDG